MKIKQPLEDTIFNWEGWIFNLLAGIYFLFFSTMVRDISITNFKGEEDVFMPWFGFVLIAISILEIYAFPKKMKYVHLAIQERGGNSGSGFLLWMFHAVISILLVMMALQSFGYDISPENDSTPWWMMLLLFATVIKELFFLFFIWGIEENISKKKYKRPNKKEWILDLILLAYMCIAYSVTWETITYNTPMEKDNLVMYILNIVVASMLFLMFYMPLRIPYLLEEMAGIKTTKDVLIFISSILLVLVPVIAALP